MREIKKIKSSEIFPLIKEMLNDGQKVWITVTGMSMYPFLREEKDSVELSATSIDSIARGDIVLIKRVSGEYILHRVLRKKKEYFYIIGDAQQWIEGPLRKEQLVAVVTSVRSRSYQISCQNKWWKLLVAFWINVIPLRSFILKGIRFLVKIRKIRNTFRRQSAVQEEK